MTWATKIVMRAMTNDHMGRRFPTPGLEHLPLTSI